MPSRPRQHQLETESRNAFRRVLPSAWVSREVTPDYGIDEHVEIFQESGQATGRTFLVQIKGTDEPALRKALTVRLRTSTAAYLSEQDLPVLIVRYHAPSERLFAKWFHSFDPHFGQEIQKSTAYRLSEDDLWDAQTPARLVDDIESFRRFRNVRINFPLEVLLSVEGVEALGISSSALRLRCRALAERFPELVRLTHPLSPGGTPPPVGINVRSDSTEVNVRGAFTLTLHHTFEYEREEVIDRVAADTWMAFCLWLGHLGEVSAAARLAAMVAAESNVLLDPEALFFILGFFVRSHRVTEALDLAERLETVGDEELSTTADIIQSTAVINAPALSEPEKVAVEAFLRRRCERTDDSGDALKGRAAYYTLGNFYRGQARPAEALPCYCRAAYLDPGYWKRAYFTRDLAGVLFGMNRYENAAHFYHVSLEIEDDELTRALFADALFFSGSFEEADQAFIAYMERAERPIAEFQLKSLMARFLKQRFGARQARRPEEAQTLASVTDDSESEDGLLERMNEALEMDSLCGLAWFNSGVAFSHMDERASALEAFLMAAISAEADVAAWGNAFGLSLSAGDDYSALGALILEAGRHFNGSRFIENLHHQALEQGPGFPVDEYLSALDNLLAQLPAERGRPAIRFLGEEGEYEEFDLGPAPDSD